MAVHRAGLQHAGRKCLFSMPVFTSSLEWIGYVLGPGCGLELPARVSDPHDCRGRETGIACRMPAVDSGARNRGELVVSRSTGRMNIETALKECLAIDGAVGVALVDFESGMS